MTNDFTGPRNMARMLALVAVALIFTVPVYVANPSAIDVGGWFNGPDSYMRMLRINEWLDGAGWYQNLSTTSNWPYGQHLHWTRPMDMLIAGGGIALSAFMQTESAIYYWAQAVSPVLVLGALAVLMRTSAGFLDYRAHVMLALMVATAPVSRNYFLAARPDHHSLFLFAFALVLGLVMLAAASPGRAKTASLGAGLMAALSLWTGVEGMVTAAFGGAALGLLWVTGTGQNPGDGPAGLRVYLWGLALGTALAMAAEHPPQEWFSSAEYDRLTTPHLVLVFLLALGGEALWRATGGRAGAGAWTRISALGLMGAVSLVPMAVMFPDFFTDPTATAMSGNVRLEWLSRIEELNPLLAGSASTALAHLLPLVPAVGWIIHARTRKTAPGQAMVIALGLGIFTLLALMQVRWAAYLGIIVALPWAAAGQRLLDWDTSPLIRTPMAIAALGAPLAIASIVAHGENAVTVTGKKESCDWKPVVAELKKLEATKGSPLNLMTHIHEGPEAAYRGAGNVVGTPHHRNTLGILDSLDVFAGTDMARTQGVLAGRKIDYVAYCTDTPESRTYLSLEGENLMRMIEASSPPRWLEPVEIKSKNAPDVAGAFRVYRFVGGE